MINSSRRASDWKKQKKKDLSAGKANAHRNPSDQTAYSFFQAMITKHNEVKTYFFWSFTNTFFFDCKLFFQQQIFFVFSAFLLLLPLTFFLYLQTNKSAFKQKDLGAGMAQWWEHLPSTNVAHVWLLDLVSYVGFFSRSSDFSSLLKKPTFPNSNLIWNPRATGLSVEDCLVSPLLNEVNF